MMLTSLAVHGSCPVLSECTAVEGSVTATQHFQVLLSWTYYKGSVKEDFESAKRSTSTMPAFAMPSLPDSSLRKHSPTCKRKGEMLFKTFILSFCTLTQRKVGMGSQVSAPLCSSPCLHPPLFCISSQVCRWKRETLKKVSRFLLHALVRAEKGWGVVLPAKVSALQTPGKYICGPEFAKWCSKIRVPLRKTDYLQ